jgi:hypothetical protein
MLRRYYGQLLIRRKNTSLWYAEMQQWRNTMRQLKKYWKHPSTTDKIIVAVQYNVMTISSLGAFPVNSTLSLGKNLKNK